MKIVLAYATALCLAFLLALESAIAQFPPPPPTSAPPEDAPPLVGKPKKKTTPSGVNITGNWIGQLTQVGSDTPHQFELAITASGAETRYPDLDCVGKLTRIGSSKSYVFFVETITKGQADKGGRCPDGTVTVARQGDKLALRWFGSIQDDVVVVFRHPLTKQTVFALARAAIREPELIALAPDVNQRRRRMGKALEMDRWHQSSTSSSRT